MHKAVKSLKLCFLQYSLSKDTFEPPKHTQTVKQGRHSNGSNIKTQFIITLVKIIFIISIITIYTFFIHDVIPLTLYAASIYLFTLLLLRIII